MLDKDILSQLRTLFKELERVINFAVFIDDSEKSEELVKFIEDFAATSPKLNVEVYKKGEGEKIRKKVGGVKSPGIVFLDEEGEYFGIKYFGIPGGHELNSFVLAVYNYSGKGQDILKKTLKRIKSIDKKIEIKVIVALSCHVCPEMVALTQRMAIENENIESTMIDVALFPEYKDKFEIRSVPCTVINDSEILFGMKKEDEFYEVVENF